jgi:hypothetical protein
MRQLPDNSNAGLGNARAGADAMMRWPVWCGALLAGLITAAVCGTLAVAVASARCCGAVTGASWGGWLVLTALVIAASAAASVGGALVGWTLERFWRRSRDARRGH